MQSLARGGLSADEVLAILQKRHRTVTGGVDLLDTDDVLIRPLTTVTGFTVRRQMYADVHGSLDLSIKEVLDWQAVRVRPWIAVNGVRFDQGVFVLERPVMQASGVLQVRGNDKMTLFQRIIGDTYWVPKSVSGSATFYLATVRDLIASSGVTGQAARIQSDADALELTEDFVQAFAPGSAPTFLSAINDGLGLVGYRGLWMDETGAPRSVPYVNPAERAAEWTLDLSDPLTNIVGPRRDFTRDDWRRTDAWLFSQRGNALAAEGSGLYYWPSKAAWDDAAANRQLYEFDAADQTSLVAQGDQQVRTDSATSKVVQIKTATLPCMGHFDIFTYRDSALGLDMKMQAREWSLSYSTSGVAEPVSLTLEVV